MNIDIAQLLPWEKDESSNFAIAITGKAFNFLRKELSMVAIFQQVLIHG
jgi:hypothetical protein